MCMSEQYETVLGLVLCGPSICWLLNGSQLQKLNMQQWGLPHVFPWIWCSMLWFMSVILKYIIWFSQCVVVAVTVSVEHYHNTSSSSFLLNHYWSSNSAPSWVALRHLTLFLVGVASKMWSVTVLWISCDHYAQIANLIGVCNLCARYFWTKCCIAGIWESPTQWIPDPEWGKNVSRVRQLKMFLLLRFPYCFGVWIYQALWKDGKTLKAELLCLGCSMRMFILQGCIAWGIKLWQEIWIPIKNQILLSCMTHSL